MSKETTIISWPQSGRTWLITMIGKVFADVYNDYDLTKFSKYGFGKDIKNLGQYNLHTFPREHEDQAWVKTPDEISEDKTYLNDMYGKGNKVPANEVKVIFLVRDPRDALVSNYNRRMKIKNPATNFRGTPSEFIRSEKGSLKSMIKWLNVWAMSQYQCYDYTLIRYEDLHIQPMYPLSKVLTFIGHGDIKATYLKQAIEFCDIENMRKIEQKEGNTNHTMFSKNINFVGDGKRGKGWDFFSEKDNRYITEQLKNLHPMYGYGD